MSANELPVAAAMNNRVEPADAACEWLSLEDLAHGSERVGGMVVRSAQLRKVLKAISRLSPYKATVLIQGESGTGKELVARGLHTLGEAHGGPFVTFNCSNLVESLAETQLFGHVLGAFTDAREDSLGYFRSANGGTLFLDEVGELPLQLQPKLLRAVETHEIQPVGSSRSYSVDIRLVAATNRDLRAMVKAGQFRDDLYYRLNAQAMHGNLELAGSDGLLGHFWNKAPVELRRTALQEIGRWLHTKEPIDFEILKRLQGLWEWRLEEVSKKQTDPRELSSFSWWFSSGQFDDEWAIDQLEQALKAAAVLEVNFDFLQRLMRMASKMPARAVRCLEAIVRQQKSLWMLCTGHGAEIRAVLNSALRGDADSAEIAEELINFLASAGLRQFSDLLRS